MAHPDRTGRAHARKSKKCMDSVCYNWHIWYCRAVPDIVVRRRVTQGDGGPGAVLVLVLCWCQ